MVLNDSYFIGIIKISQLLVDVSFLLSLVLIHCRWWEGLRPTETPGAVPTIVKTNRRGRKRVGRQIQHNGHPVL